jgi:hypothetical protein
MQQYDFKVAANATFPLGATGRYIKYASGNNGGGDVSLVVSPVGQPASKIVLVPGQAFRVSDTGPTPSGWVLSNNAGGATISGYVVVGDGRIDDPTINGTVQIVDGSKERTMAGIAYSGSGITQAAAGVVSRVQLFNPASNPNRLVVEQITPVGASTANTMSLVFNQVALATNLEPGGIAKKAGAANSAAQINGDTSAVIGSTAGVFMWLAAQVNTSSPFKLNEPIVLPPGWGIVAWGATANVQTGCNFEWYEEPNV